MTKTDPLPNWSEPAALRDWAQEASRPLEKASAAYVNLLVHPDVVVASARLLFPVFVEHDGGVFLDDHFSQESYAEWKSTLGDTSRVEDMLNHRHVYDLFMTPEEVTEDSFEGVARLMAQTLELALRVCFPHRRFNVYVSNDEGDYGPVVSFYSLAEEAPASTGSPVAS